MTDAGDTSWIRQLAGRFVVFDGPDGSGKTTQFHRFADFVEKHGVAICEVREPGGTAIGEEVRNLLLDPANKEEINTLCEMLLFMASRAQLVAQRIRPALAAGQLVLADRFISSTMAYQGTAGGIPIDDIISAGKIALQECWPDLVVVFDVDQATAATRLSPLLDRMEQKGADYHKTVRQGYLDQAARDPEKYLVINATVKEDEVFQRLMEAMASRFA